MKKRLIALLSVGVFASCVGVSGVFAEEVMSDPIVSSRTVYSTFEQDIGEGTYDGYFFLCHSSGSPTRVAGEINFENTTPSVSVELSVRLSNFNGMYSRTETVTESGRESALAIWDDAFNYVALSAAYTYDIGSSTVYRTSLTWPAY